jgi:hypothetical protein
MNLNDARDLALSILQSLPSVPGRPGGDIRHRGANQPSEHICRNYFGPSGKKRCLRLLPRLTRRSSRRCISLRRLMMRSLPLSSPRPVRGTCRSRILSHRHHLGFPMLFSDAMRLATMPRRKSDEFTQAAFWAFLTSLPGGFTGIYDLMLEKPIQPKGLDLLLFSTALICLAAMVIGSARRASDGETSEEYLNRLYKLPPPPKPRWRIWR